tara:strand:+ start:1415 stop:2140 length:726 start_codon:yes stop_codon:yes gene_type:complete
MPRFDNLDSIVNDFAIRMGTAQQDIIQSLSTLVKGTTHEEATIILSNIDIQSITSTKIAGAITLFDKGVENILVNTFTTANVDERALRALMLSVRNDLSSRFVNTMPQQLLREVSRGISLQMTPSQILSSFTDIYDYKPYQLEAIINTAFSQYSNSMMNMIADKLPDDTLFVYIGPNDAKTRDECVERINMGKVTRQEILDSRFGNMDNAIWNCRHGWEQLSDKPKAQGYRPNQLKDDPNA